MSGLPRALARLILPALLACLSASFAARAQGAEELDQAYQAELQTESAALRARVARLAPAVQALNKQVAQAILAGDWPVAERLGADMARLDPANADIRHFQGRLLALQKRYAPAIEKFDQAIALDAGNRWFLVSKAGAQADAGDLEGALRSAQTLCERFPDWSIGHNLRAALLDGLDRAPEALAAYERAIAAPPPSAQILVNQGMLLRRLGRLADARSAFDAALRLQPDYARAQAELDSLPAR
ncbi:tetratricopeptide repeat protein [Achromobacter sp. Marseille-Q0513]|uniref:tetratricopeptide repeat protein n=1 Tax=Achromobacter sp. Marseille-Q0513 TaxID=2829161 RepID=UPI001B924004|nr:tetratricopeptide repeat protein [Achromobacter sp. Marseille-Q0513]MBR8657488.1 tetratricopeptide repeat protein [Achromobacter sp. Marseille-Q0513]